MAHLYKSKKMQTDPTSGKRVPVVDGKGRQVYHPAWRFQYLDYQGRTKTATGYASKDKTYKLALEIEAEHRQIREGHKPVPQSADRAALRPFPEVVAEYLAEGNSRGGRGGRPWGERHAKMRRDQLRWWQEQAGFTTLADLDNCLPRVEKILRDEAARGRSGKTLQNKSSSLQAFCRWCMQRGYLDKDPLQHLGKFNTSPRTKRRALTRDEVRRLIEVAPEPRRLLYKVALATGLRANELRSLKVADLKYDFKSLTLHAEWTKNRRPGLQPLPDSLFDELVERSKDKDLADELLTVSKHHLTENLYRDLKSADIPRWTPEGHVDFHALRNTCATVLIEMGADIKTVQTIMRHHSIDLTLNVYGRARAERLKSAAESLGECVCSSACPEQESTTLKTGTESGSLMAGPTGIEPATSGLTGQRSNRTELRPLLCAPASYKNGPSISCAPRCASKQIGGTGFEPATFGL